jgi:hypothetical protein
MDTPADGFPVQRTLWQLLKSLPPCHNDTNLQPLKAFLRGRSHGSHMVPGHAVWEGGSKCGAGLFPTVQGP